MRHVNRVALLGVLVDFSAPGAAGNNPVCNFEIKTVEEWTGKRGPERRETVHVCVAFGPMALAVETMRLGDHVYVEGSSRGDRDAADDYAAEVVCSVVIPVAEPSTERVMVGMEGQQ